MSLKRNLIYNSVLTASNYLFPLLTFPYVSRVLGPSSFGAVNFIDGIINYGVLLSMMGISTLGIRLMSKYRLNPAMQQAVFTGLALISSIFTLISILIIPFLHFFSSSLYPYQHLLLIGAAKIAFNFLLFEWFFIGIENFRFITHRNIAIRLIYVIAVFALIKRPEDYVLYYALTALLFGLNAIINIYYLRRYIKLQYNKRILLPLFKPYLKLGFYVILNSTYTTFNVAFLGFAANEEQVGYYVTAIKLYTIVVSLFSAFSGVVLPRMSLLLANNQVEDAKRLIEKSFELLFTFSFPLIILTIYFAPEAVHLLSGSAFDGAIIPMYIVMPLVFIVGILEILITQVLMPLKKENLILINAIVGAAITVILSLALVPHLQSTGSALVLFLSQLVIMVLSFRIVARHFPFGFPVKKLIQQTLASLPIVLICNLSSFIGYPVWIRLIIVATLTTVYFLLCQNYIVKNEIVISFTNAAKTKLWHIVAK